MDVSFLSMLEGRPGFNAFMQDILCEKQIRTGLNVGFTDEYELLKNCQKTI
jgi:hypothetical protein